MIDERLISNNDYLLCFRNRFRKAQEHALSLPNYKKLDTILQKWWAAALDMVDVEKRTPYDVADLLYTKLSTQNKPSVFLDSQHISLPTEFLLALDSLSSKPDQISDETWDTAWFILGMSIGKSLACNKANIRHMTIS